MMASVLVGRESAAYPAFCAHLIATGGMIPALRQLIEPSLPLKREARAESAAVHALDSRFRGNDNALLIIRS